MNIRFLQEQAEKTDSVIQGFSGKLQGSVEESGYSILPSTVNVTSTGLYTATFFVANVSANRLLGCVAGGITLGNIFLDMIKSRHNHQTAKSNLVRLEEFKTRIQEVKDAVEKDYYALKAGSPEARERLIAQVGEDNLREVEQNLEMEKYFNLQARVMAGAAEQK